MIGKLHVKKCLDLIALQDRWDMLRRENEKRNNGNDHAQHAKEDESAAGDSHPCHHAASFIISADGVERDRAVDQCEKTKQKAGRETDEPSQRDWNHTAAKREEGENAKDEADDGMPICFWGRRDWGV